MATISTTPQLHPPAAGYTRTAIALHWAILGFIAGAFALGWVMTDLAVSPLKLRMYSWHKWLGISVLLAGVFRVVWRATHAPPPPEPMPAWQQTVAHALHGLLYLLLLLLPMSGWLYSSASGFPVVYLGVVPLPDLVHKDRALAQVLREVHEAGGWLLFATVLLHAAAALKHHLVDHDDTLKRMLRWRR